MNEVVSTQAKGAGRGDPKVLAGAGAVLLGLAGMFLWKDLALAPEALGLVGAACAAGFAAVAHKKQWAAAGPLALGVAGLVCGLWYAATRMPITLAGAGIAFVVSLVLTVRSHKAFRSPTAQLHRTVSWLGAVGNGLITTFGLYFLVFDATESSLNQFIARRVLLTMMWLLSGTAMVIWGAKREAGEARMAGFVALAAAMAKLLMYDLEHTDGFVRIAALAIGGAVLLGAGRVTALVGKGKA